MTEVIRLAALALVIGIAAFLLREMGWRGAVAFSVFGAAALLSFLSDGLSKFIDGVYEIGTLGGISEITKDILKVVGASYVFGISADICSELGEKALSTALTSVGRVEIFLISMPYFMGIVKSAVGLVGAQ